MLAILIVSLLSACVPGQYGSGGYNNGGYYGSGYDDDYYYDRERERLKDERRDTRRERERLEEERERLERERERREREESRRPPPPPPVRIQERCPSGFTPSENKCSREERKRGCKDMRLPGGLGCVKR